MQIAVRRAIIVCALDYFIDIFDIQLFAVLRVPSLTELGISADKITTVGAYILNVQMLGMLLGAFLWGWLGDRFGRLKALYGSILVYSLGTLLCSVVHDPIVYGIYRFIAGFGLAGETGAAITLIAELMTPQKRGWGTTIIGGFGAFGPVLAVLISWFLPWRETYLVAGALGLILFILRMKLLEPSLFQKINEKNVIRSFQQLFSNSKHTITFLSCVILAVGTIFGANLLNFFSMEISRGMLMPGEVFNQKTCLLFFYVGLGLGNFITTALSQLLQSRRKGVAVSLTFGAVVIAFYLMIGPIIKFPILLIYILNFAIGLAGNLALAATIAAEQFGTNVRASSAILMSNLARGMNIPVVLAFQFLREFTSITNAAALVGLVLYTVSFFALYHLRETYGVDLDYIEK